MFAIIPPREGENQSKKQATLTCRTCKLKRCVGRCRWESPNSLAEPARQKAA